MKRVKGPQGAGPLALAVSMGVCLLAGFIGSIPTAPAVPTWYAALSKPSFTPPDWVFAPVWMLLYILMGIAVFLVWRVGWERGDVKIALRLFGVQLVLNITWSFIFFGMRSPGAALMELVLLCAALLLTIRSFLRISRVAGVLLLPYLAWVSFAAVLNLCIVVLNR